MSHLHTINNPALLDLCLRSVESGDCLILIEDGVYCAQQEQAVIDHVDVALYALQHDLEARGLADRIDENVTPVTDSDFVRLCCEQDKVINWF